MGKYIKKPVEVEAIQFTGDNIEKNIKPFLGKSKYTINNNSIIISTLEGDMKCSKNDYIIKGVNGEFYPCKPDIFEKTYEFKPRKSKIKVHYPSMNLELINELPICGCGKPDEVYELIHYWLKDIRDKKFGHLHEYEKDKDVDIRFRYLLLYILDDHEFIEHGTTIHCPWITDKGNDLIDVLDEFEKLDYHYNNISYNDEYWYIPLDDDEYEKFETELNNKYTNGYKMM